MVCVCVCVYLVAVVDSRCDLSEDDSGFCFWQSPPLLDVIVQLPPAGVLHHYHDLVPALEHYTGHIYSAELHRCVYMSAGACCLYCATMGAAILHV